MRTARRLMITVDVEAQPGRAEADHVNRLIWGKYRERRGGISEMMDIADQHSAKLVFFVDYCERALYGDAMLDVGREIARRGHDSQLHSHPEFLSARFWSDRGFDRPGTISEASEQQALALIEFVCESHERATGTPPIAYRGGGYRFSPALLRSLSECAVRLDSSYNAGRQSDLVVCARKQFLWDNGCLELPVSVVNPFRNINRGVEFNFGASALASVERMLEYLEAFYLQYGEDAIAVIVLHSWSFSKLQASGHFSPPLEENLERFSNFLAALTGRIEVVTAGDVLALSDAGLLTLGQTMALPPPIASTLLEGGKVHAGSALSKEPKCPICGAAKSRFEKMEGRQCPDCGSLERQRAFAIGYDRELKFRCDVSGRHALIFAPSSSELKFLRARNLASWTSIDIRPEAKPNLIADVCRMPEIASRSQSLVFASYLMAGVYDLHAALGEIERVLTPDGTFFSVEVLQWGRPTIEVKDESAQTAWYGKENFDRYRVGTYRTLGGDDYQRALEERFSVSMVEARDPITGVAVTIMLCRKRQQVTSESAGSFERVEALYRKTQSTNSKLTYAQWSVSNQINYIKRGGEHPSLGPNLARNRRWASAGAGTFAEYRRLVPSLTERSRVVDYGCGSLRVGQHFIQYLNPDSYIGLDIWKELIDMGVSMMDPAIVSEKRPWFGEIDQEGVQRAIDFDSDFVLACAVAYQVHPVDHAEFVFNLQRIAHRPGAVILFDTKLAASHFRFKNSGWAWTQSFYDQLFAGFEPVAQKYQQTQRLAGVDVETHLFVYRRR